MDILERYRKRKKVKSSKDKNKKSLRLIVERDQRPFPSSV